ncbi:MAG: hypothetical protein ACP5O3_03520 [Candidatus Micrarchaeia archaeon]
MEFLAVLSLALVLLLLVSVLSFGERAKAAEVDSLVEAKAVAEEVAGLVNSAGFSRAFNASFYPPALVGGQEYSLNVSSDGVTVYWGGDSYFAGVRAKSVACMACPFAPPGKLVVSSVGGSVLVERE